MYVKFYFAVMREKFPSGNIPLDSFQLGLFIKLCDIPWDEFVGVIWQLYSTDGAVLLQRFKIGRKLAFTNANLLRC